VCHFISLQKSTLLTIMYVVLFCHKEVCCLVYFSKFILLIFLLSCSIIRLSVVSCLLFIMCLTTAFAVLSGCQIVCPLVFRQQLFHITHFIQCLLLAYKLLVHLLAIQLCCLQFWFLNLQDVSCITLMAIYLQSTLIFNIVVEKAEKPFFCLTVFVNF